MKNILRLIKKVVNKLILLTTSKLTIIFKHMTFKLQTTNFIIGESELQYQPLPWIGLNKAQIRGDATRIRWDLIKQNLTSSDNSLKDIGSCYGFFCFKFAEMSKSNQAIGIDSNKKFFDVANYVIEKNESFRNQVYFLNSKITPQNIYILPPTDVTLILSIWHHWYFYYGQENALKMLKNVIDKTNKKIFIEIGEDEVAEEFNYPVKKDVKNWFKELLKKELSINLQEIGLSEAGSYQHYEIKNHKRTLFLIEK